MCSTGNSLAPLDVRQGKEVRRLGMIARMAPAIPDPARIKSFRTQAAFEKWMAVEPCPRDRDLAEDPQEGLRPAVGDACAGARRLLCAGGGSTASASRSTSSSFLQRYTPRRARSIWSQINRDHVARLTAAGRMTPHGQRQVDAAKADGRWDAAYAPMRSASAATIPEDLRAAIEAEPARAQDIRARSAARTCSRSRFEPTT